ncbi:MAG: peptidase MA family metallohydrolase [Acidobacteriota bacterium]
MIDLALVLIALQAGPAGLVPIEASPFTLRCSPPLARRTERLATGLPATLSRLRRSLDAPPLPPTNLYLLLGPSAPRDGPLGSLLEAMPEWAAGVAFPGAHAAVIRVDRIGSYGQRELSGVVAHEIVHLLMAEAAASGPGRPEMPRWFSEGVASNLAGQGEWLDFIYFWVSGVASSPQPLARLQASFEEAGSAATRNAAYAGSFEFVRFLIRRHSARFPARVLAGLRAGLGFQQAYARATGTTLRMDEARWASSRRGMRRWMAIMTSPLTLWSVITFLFLLAYGAKKLRSRRLMRRWQEDDLIR